MNKSTLLEKFEAFEKQLGYFPAENVKMNIYGDFNPAAIYSTKGYSNLTGIVINSDRIDFYLYVASILGSAPAFSHAMRYRETDEGNRIMLKGQGTIKVFHILRDLISSTYDSFDSYWKRLEPHLDALRSYWIEDLHEPDFTYGNAQKWISVAIKHLYALIIMSKHEEIREYANMSLFCHAGMPIDNLMERYLKLPESGIEIHFDRAPYSNRISWGNVDDKDIFYRYQKAVLAKVLETGKAENLFEYELSAWPGAAKLANTRIVNGSGKAQSLLTIRAREVNAALNSIK